MDDLQRPANLSKNLLVGERCHVRVGPGVYANVVVELLECAQEDLRVIADVGTDHEMCHRLVLRLEEVVEPRARVGL